MKHLLLPVFYTFVSCVFSQVNFDKYFENSSLRIDYIHAGDTAHEYFFLEELRKEDYWGGPVKNLLDTFRYGEYMLKVFDKSENRLIYSHGFCTLFEEWITTAEAGKLQRSFYETQLVPYPKKAVYIEIQGRNDKNEFEKRYSLEINPEDHFINKDKHQGYEVYDVHLSGKPNEKVDIVFIPDGYTQDEMDKFKRDADRFRDYFFTADPYKDNRDKFNIRAVLAASAESGTDIPGENIWVNTIAGSSFYTFDSERYLMTYDVKSLRDIAASVPYDQIYIIVNTDKYGGGAIYNYYNAVAADNEAARFVMLNEFGHGFGGLADEYYDSEVSYEDFFDLETEPWQPNLTTLKNFEKKWKSMIEKDIPVPTPAIDQYSGKVGVYEGGGYVAKGVYRPAQDCIMKSGLARGYCPVCRKAVTDMIVFLCDE
ncbi:MAG: IgA Peptidase M64 [Bacteroidetes bacterium]|nr:IgA Peptidase M64 [Bacteroidota bacterium]